MNLHNQVAYNACDAENGRNFVDIGAFEKNPDRRGERRFPLRLRLTFSSAEAPSCSGYGLSLQISSREIVFVTESALTVGRYLKVAIDWPVRLESKVPLKLVVFGHVVRIVESQVVVTVEKHEFRIRRAEPVSEISPDPKKAASDPFPTALNA